MAMRMTEFQNLRPGSIQMIAQPNLRLMILTNPFLTGEAIEAKKLLTGSEAYSGGGARTQQLVSPTVPFPLESSSLTPSMHKDHLGSGAPLGASKALPPTYLHRPLWLRSASPPRHRRPHPSRSVHVPARGAPGLLLPRGWAFGWAADRGPGRRRRRRPGAAAAPAAAALAAGRAAAAVAASLRGHRCRRGSGRAAGALLPPGSRRRCRRGPGLCAAARPPAAVTRAAAADPGLLHGGAQLRGAVAEQLSAGEELVPVLGRLLGDTLWNHRINNLEKAYDTPGKPLCAAVCGLCPLKSSWIYPRLPRGPVCVQRPQKIKYFAYTIYYVACQWSLGQQAVIMTSGFQGFLDFSIVDLGEGKICFCCEEFQPAKCTDKENALKLFPVQPCSAVHLLLKKVLFALCALNALTTTVCLVAAALRYLQIFATRRSCIDESQISAEEVEDHGRIPDPDDFVPPVPPPSYFATFYSCTPRMNRRMVGPDVIPLPHIYGARIKGVEVFCPLDPPPPYEAVVSQMDQEQRTAGRPGPTHLFKQLTGSNERGVKRQQNNPLFSCDAGIFIPNGRRSRSCYDPTGSGLHTSGAIPNIPAEENASMSTPSSTLVRPMRSRRALPALRTRSKSDPVLHHSEERAAPVLSCEAATQTERRLDLAAVTLRRGLRSRASRCRPQSLIDYKSYLDTKLLVARFLEQSSCTMTPDIHELVENIKSVLKSDEEHMEEAITSASFLEQIMAPLQSSTSRARTLPSRRQPGLLHLQSCGDLSTFTPAGRPRAERRSRRVEAERPHSLIGVIRETVL
ncbi:hypothetical protein H8959_012467 [Pygathrix nigripes]